MQVPLSPFAHMGDAKSKRKLCLIFQAEIILDIKDRDCGQNNGAIEAQFSVLEKKSETKVTFLKRNKRNIPLYFLDLLEGF